VEEHTDAFWPGKESGGTDIKDWNCNQELEKCRDDPNRHADWEKVCPFTGQGKTKVSNEKPTITADSLMTTMQQFLLTIATMHRFLNAL